MIRGTRARDNTNEYGTRYGTKYDTRHDGARQYERTNTE